LEKYIDRDEIKGQREAAPFGWNGSQFGFKATDG
jgi:hypothetical protein